MLTFLFYGLMVALMVIFVELMYYVNNRRNKKNDIVVRRSNQSFINFYESKLNQFTPYQMSEYVSSMFYKKIKVRHYDNYYFIDLSVNNLRDMFTYNLFGSKFILKKQHKIIDRLISIVESKVFLNYTKSKYQFIIPGQGEINSFSPLILSCIRSIYFSMLVRRLKCVGFKRICYQGFEFYVKLNNSIHSPLLVFGDQDPREMISIVESVVKDDKEKQIIFPILWNGFNSWESASDALLGFVQNNHINTIDLLAHGQGTLTMTAMISSLLKVTKIRKKIYYDPLCFFDKNIKMFRDFDLELQVDIIEKYKRDGFVSTLIAMDINSKVMIGRLLFPDIVLEQGDQLDGNCLIVLGFDSIDISREIMMTIRSNYPRVKLFQQKDNQINTIKMFLDEKK